MWKQIDQDQKRRTAFTVTAEEDAGKMQVSVSGAWNVISEGKAGF